MSFPRTHRWALPMLAAFSLAAQAWGESTVWLVRPLYPGQEALIERTQAALSKLIPGEARAEAIIGTGELAKALEGKAVDEVPCLSGAERCADPIDRFVSKLGFGRVVLIQGGQDETGFTYRVASYEPSTGKVTPASATNANLEKALLGAVAKVVPAASKLDVQSIPPGATVFIDDVKVGVTPLSTQVLPGERIVRLDLKLHQPVEDVLLVPLRGQAQLEKTLEKVAARIAITAQPPGAEIAIDGKVLGKDKIDRGIDPGTHVIRITAPEHRAFEQSITVLAEKQYEFDKTLEPIVAKVEPESVKARDGKLIRSEPLPPPPPPREPTQTEKTYALRSYFHLAFESSNLLGGKLVGRRFGENQFGRTTALTPSNPMLLGAGAEYGTMGRLFGLTVVGLSYLTNLDTWSMGVGFEENQHMERSPSGVEGPSTLDPVRVNLVTLRLIQPQFRVAIWRFMLGLQAGLEFRTGQISGVNDTFYKNGFMPIDLMLTGKVNGRFVIVEGLFFLVQANYTLNIPGLQKATDASGAIYESSNSAGFSAGVGYGF